MLSKLVLLFYSDIYLSSIDIYDKVLGVDTVLTKVDGSQDQSMVFDFQPEFHSTKCHESVPVMPKVPSQHGTSFKVVLIGI